MGDDPLPTELNEKEDGEIDSDQEDENQGNARVSPNLNPHEEDIDKLLASCHENPGDTDQLVSPNSLVSDGICRKEKESTPSAYRKRSNDMSEERSSRIERSSRPKDSHRSSSTNRQKSRRRKQKRARNDSRDKTIDRSSGVEGTNKCGSRDIDNIDNELIEKNRKGRENSAKEEELLRSSLIIVSKANELKGIEQRRETLNEDARKLEEKKARLAKSERSVMMKKGYISDMCKRRDDYIARVQRLIQDIEGHMKEESDMIKDTNELRKEVREEEVKWQIESNQLANDHLKTLLRVEEESEAISIIEVEEVVSDNREEDEGVVEKEQEVISHDFEEEEEALRNMLLMQLVSKEKSAEVEMVPIKSIEDTIGVKDCDKDEVEDMEIEDEVEGEITIERGDDMSSTMCPWDLNGICKDDECPFLHNRSSSRAEYSQEITV